MRMVDGAVQVVSRRAANLPSSAAAVLNIVTRNFGRHDS